MNFNSRYLQFIALEDGVSLIGECVSNESLDDDQMFTMAELRELRRLGWNDPRPPRAPNWFFEVTTPGDLSHLNELTARTLRGVFGLQDEDILYLSINEVLAGVPGQRQLAR
jgi:hypothetical protein